MSPDNEIFWIKDLKLSISDKKYIENGDWLSDNIINAWQVLLKEQFPQMMGLESVSLGYTLAFSVCKQKFVQILNVNNNHWITVSSEG